MSEFEQQPIVITDKRELRRLAVQARKQEQAGDVEAVEENERSAADDMYVEYLRRQVANGTATEQEREEFLRLQAEAEPEEQEPGIDCLTAFYVIVGHDGGAIAIPDNGQTIRAERAPTFNDMYAGCAIVQRDIQASLSGQQSATSILQQGQALQQQQAQSQAAMLAAKGIDPSQLRRRG